MASETSAESWRTARSELSGSVSFSASPLKDPSLPTPSLSPPRIAISPPSQPSQTPSPSPLSPTPLAPSPSPAMAQTTTNSRVNDLGNGMFDLVVWRDPDLSGEAFVDVWLADLGLDPMKHYPSIPEEYELEWREKRCVYLFGVPKGVTQDQLQIVLEKFGNVEYLPIIIDLVSEETFRFAIMATNAEAQRVIDDFANVFPLSLVPAGHHRSITAVTALKPGRNIIRGGVAVATNHINSFLDKPTIWGSSQDLGAGPSNNVPTRFHNTRQLRAAIDRAASLICTPIEASIAQSFSLPSVPANSRSQTPLSAQQPALSSSPGYNVFDTLTHLPVGPRRTKSIFSDIFASASKVNRKDNVGPKGDGKGQRGDMNSATVQNQDGMTTIPQTQVSMNNPAKRVDMRSAAVSNQGSMNNNVLFSYAGQPTQNYTMNPNSSSYYGYTQRGAQSEGYNSYAYSQFYVNAQIRAAPTPLVVDPLVELLRKNAVQAPESSAYSIPTYAIPARPYAPSTQPSAFAVNQQPASIVPVVPILTSARKASNPLVAVPDIALLNERARTRTLSISKGGPAPKEKPADTTLAVKEPLTTITEASKTPEEETNLQPTKAPVPAPAPAAATSSAFSWAAVAGSLPSGSNTIDVSSRPLATSRPRALTQIPVSAPNPSKIEPLVEQMRIVFLLNIPSTLTLDDVSNGLAMSGPIRSIHFGMDEEKQSRYCAVVFLHATDASNFTIALLKERADNRPVRFKFIVDVARGEEPAPLDDILRSMLPPISATRRLTLVKKAFFTPNSKRVLTQKIERVAGDGCIQKIFFYNSGNATIFFSDVGSATTCKTEFERLAATDDTWRDLTASYSKDPCTVDAADMRLITVHAEWNN